MGLVPSALDEGHHLGMTHALNVHPIHLHGHKGRIIRSASLLGALIISSLDFVMIALILFKTEVCELTLLNISH